MPSLPLLIAPLLHSTPQPHPKLTSCCYPVGGGNKAIWETEAGTILEEEIRKAVERIKKEYEESLKEAKNAAKKDMDDLKKEREDIEAK
jgi:hypothetical protein